MLSFMWNSTKNRFSPQFLFVSLKTIIENKFNNPSKNNMFYLDYFLNKFITRNLQGLKVKFLFTLFFTDFTIWEIENILIIYIKLS